MIPRALLACFGLATLCHAIEPIATSDFVFGKNVTIHSAVLGEDRSLQIYVPANYESAKASYPTLPVMYLLDGETHYTHVAALVDRLATNSRIPPMIVVAIDNTDRTRDLTPTHTNLSPLGKPDDNLATSGGSAKFFEFMRDELVPFVEGRYRAAPFRILAGHSFGGLVVVESLLKNPATFQAYLAISPTLIWDNRVLLNNSGPIGRAGQFVWVSVGSEGAEFRSAVGRFVAQLRSRAAPGLAWNFKPYDNEAHSSQVHPSVFDGLNFIFADWDPLRRAIDDDPTSTAELVQHYARLSEKYGYPIPPPLPRLFDVGLYYTFKERWDDAIAAEQEAAKRYPQADSPYTVMAQAYTKKGDTESAMKALEKALELNPRNGDAREELAKLRAVKPGSH